MMKSEVRHLRSGVLGVLLAFLASSVQAAQLGDHETLGDGVMSLSGADGSITTNNVDGKTFWWADKNGDGTTGDAVSPGLDMAGFDLSNIHRLNI